MICSCGWTDLILENACLLNRKQLNRYLDASSRTWLLDDEALEELNNDIQSVIDCTEKGDSVMFAASKVVTPSSRIVIPWTLTLGSSQMVGESENGTLAEASTMTTLTCPNNGTGIFLIK